MMLRRYHEKKIKEEPKEVVQNDNKPRESKKRPESKRKSKR
jgi:hypothetical protein